MCIRDSPRSLHVSPGVCILDVPSGREFPMRVFCSWALALALCSTAAMAEARDLPDIKKQGHLRVVAVVEEREPEFVSLKPGGAPGFDREILEGFARIQGVGLEFVLAPNWQVLMPSL